MAATTSLESLLGRIDSDRRQALRKMLVGVAAGTAVYAAPVVMSFGLNDLGGVARAQASNQTAQPVPVDSGVGLAAAAGAVAVAGAMMLGRRSRS